MERGGRNGQRGGRGGGRGGNNRGWETQQSRGGGNQRNNNGGRQQGGGGQQGAGGGGSSGLNNGGGNASSSQQAWPSLGGRPGQAPAPTSWRAAGSNASAGGGGARGSSLPPQQSRPPQSAWPGLPQGATQPPPASAWNNGAPRPLGVPAAQPPSAGGATTAPRVQNPNDASTSGAAVAAGGGRAAEHMVVREDARGATRGKRTITEEFLIRTKPQDLVTKSGTSGRPISVQTNYFLISKKPDWSIHQYRIDFAPDVEMPRVRKAYLNHHHEMFGGRLSYIFDGTMLFTTTYLPQARERPVEVNTKNREGETIQIKIRHVGIVDASDIQQLHVLNLIMRHSMEGLKLQLLNRNYYDPRAVIHVEQFNLEIWPGYITSIRQHERDILLCCELAHKVLRRDTLYDILMQCRNEANPQDAFKQKVIGTIVLTDYNNKTYRIDDVDFSISPRSTFTRRSDQASISYIDYYRQAWNLTIRDPRQPLLCSRPTEKNVRGGETDIIYLVPELSRATGMTDEMRNDFRLMKAVSEYTRLVPEKRIQRLITYNRRLQTTPESMAYLQAWRMHLDTNLVEAPARVLPTGRILFGNNAVYTCTSNADWTRELHNKRMISNKNLTRWSVIVPGCNVREIQLFLKHCQKAGQAMGMSISMPIIKETPDDRTLSYARAIDEMRNQDCQILMVVIKRQNEEKYSCIKKKCCIDMPIASQVCTLTKIAPRPEKQKSILSIATKVVIQMNAKLGGIPWSVDLQIKDSVMFIGFDVCHSAKDRNQSIGALVATMDTRRSGSYFSTVVKHMKGQELSNDIANSVGMALRTYQEELGGLPDRIIFYRDGVGDGQLHQVYNHEVKRIKEKVEGIYASLKLRARIAFVVVSKRINTRLFTNGRNPEPGTVVDDVITLPERYDFYLVSQSVNQGTVSPTSYNVIYDTSGYSADALQKLTYAQTHMYYNWSGTCRVPAVCQYAHKLAALVAEHIHLSPSNLLSKKLYFL